MSIADMKVLIQDKQNRKFFTADYGWASDAQSAQDFQSHRKAYATARQAPVAQFNIILYSPLGHYAFPIDHGRNELCN